MDRLLPFTSVRIAAFDFRIVEEDRAWSRSAHTSAQVDCEHFTIRMFVGEPRSLRQIACDLVHEACHALIWVHSIGRPGDGDSLTEEQACDLAGYEMADFWRSNPDVFDWYATIMRRGFDGKEVSAGLGVWAEPL